METRSLIEQLGRPEAYPHTVENFRVHQTHISVVFLAGSYAYKVKKPLDLGFLDFTTPEKRHHFCHEEVRLNRRLAPDVYLGVVPITRESGILRVGGDGEAVEWAVKMVRLPPEATLRERLLRDGLTVEALEALARRVADFHAEAESGAKIARCGRFEAVAENARENLDQSREHVGVTLSETVQARLARALEARLDELRPVIERRAARHVPRDTHGDLHLDHVYLFPDREPPGDLVIVDCIEFGERFRYADPVSDTAFLAMDLIQHGRRDLEERFSRTYFETSGDEEGRSLLPFYRSYRAAVRGKVEGMVIGEEEVPRDERRAAVGRARGHWLLALSELEAPARRPGLVLGGGLPGTGKSTVAEGLASRAGFRLISSDRTRKALAGVEADAPARAEFEEGIYAPTWTERTYDACLTEVGSALFGGERVLVDATFREEAKRERFLEAALEHGVRALYLECRAAAETVRERMRRREGGVSDADWSIYRDAAERWEDSSTLTRRHRAEVRTDGAPQAALDLALDHLRRAGLHGGTG
jgi:uncharacterized protein